MRPTGCSRGRLSIRMLGERWPRGSSLRRRWSSTRPHLLWPSRELCPTHALLLHHPCLLLAPGRRDEGIDPLPQHQLPRTARVLPGEERVRQLRQASVRLELPLHPADREVDVQTLSQAEGGAEPDAGGRRGGRRPPCPAAVHLAGVQSENSDELRPCHKKHVPCHSLWQACCGQECRHSCRTSPRGHVGLAMCLIVVDSG